MFELVKNSDETVYTYTDDECLVEFHMDGMVTDFIYINGFEIDARDKAAKSLYVKKDNEFVSLHELEKQAQSDFIDILNEIDRLEEIEYQNGLFLSSPEKTGRI